MRSFYRLVPLVVTLILATACGQNTPQSLPTLVASATAIPPTTTAISNAANAPTPQPTTDPTAKPGRVRLIHAAGDTGVINVYAGFLTVATNLDFTQATEPTPLAAGEYSIKITQSGSQPNDLPLFETQYALKSGASDILVVAKNDGQFQLLTFPETVVPLNAGESVITFVQAIAGPNAVTVRQDEASITDSAVPFGQSYTTRVLPSGATTLHIDTGSGTATTYPIDLQEQQQYTLVLSGGADALAVAQYATAAPGRTRVRAINASEPIGAVDVYLDEMPLADGIAFGRPTDWQDLISGDYTVSVYTADADRATSEPLTSQLLALEAGQNIALLVLGSSNRLLIVPFNEDLSATPLGKARITFLNTLESVATLRVETSGGPLSDVQDTGFGQTPGQTLLDASSYNFYLTRAGATEANQTVETVQNVQLEQGTYYLYLVTGRQDNQPVILSYDVGFDESLTNVSPEDVVEAGAENMIQLRFINAIVDQTPVDFQVNSQTITSGIRYGQGSELMPTEQRTATIGAVVAGSGDFLQSSDNILESGSRYSIIAYGPDRANVRLMVVPDDELIFDGQSPHLRLINLSVNTDTALGLGFSPQDPTPVSGTPAPVIEDLRRSIPGGIQRLVNGVAGSERSSVILMPMGIYDLEIIDSNTDQLATTLSNNPLDAGAHYDVIVYEERDSIRIRGFVVEYPTQSGS